MGRRGSGGGNLAEISRAGERFPAGFLVENLFGLESHPCQSRDEGVRRSS